MRLEVGVFGEGFALDQRSGWEVEGLVGMVEIGSGNVLVEEKGCLRG